MIAEAPRVILEPALDFREIKELSGLFMIPSEQPHVENSNAYILTTSKGLFLFDAGGVCNVRKIKSSLSVFGYSIDDIDTVFLTDVHADHMGGAAMLQEENPKIKVATTRIGKLILEVRDPKLTAWYLYPHLHREYELPTVRVHFTIEGSEKPLDLNDLHEHYVQIIETPGHSPASVSYLIDGKILVVGDAVNGGYNDRTIGSNKEQWKITLKKLSNCGFQYFMDGHGDVRSLPYPRDVYLRAIDMFGTRGKDFKDLINYWGGT